MFKTQFRFWLFINLLVFVFCASVLFLAESFGSEEYVAPETYYPGREHVLQEIRILQHSGKLSLGEEQELNLLCEYDMRAGQPWGEKLPFHYDACSMPLSMWLEYNDEEKQTWTAENCSRYQEDGGMAYIVELTAIQNERLEQE